MGEQGAAVTAAACALIAVSASLVAVFSGDVAAIAVAAVALVSAGVAMLRFKTLQRKSVPYRTPDASEAPRQVDTSEPAPSTALPNDAGPAGPPASRSVHEGEPKVVGEALTGSADTVRPAVELVDPPGAHGHLPAVRPPAVALRPASGKVIAAALLAAIAAFIASRSRR